MLQEPGPESGQPDSDKPREACGVIGVYLPNEDAARNAFFGLFALQHRGQESAGISSSDGQRLHTRTSMGLVNQVFREQDLADLPGSMAIGHTRYSTMGSSEQCNAQPLLADGPAGRLALGHNGNLINAALLREDLIRNWGVEFQGNSDSEVIAHMFAKAPGTTWEERSAYCMRRMEGAYSLVMLTSDELIGVRDPLGVRPLCVGRLNGGWVLASESCALDNIGAELEREVLPGETVVINSGGVRSFRRPGASAAHSMCIFEHIYFSRPDSILDGKLTYLTRTRMGAEVYKLHPVEADLVIGIPDSSTPHAVGFAAAAGIPYGEGIIRNRYVGRTFIEPDQRMRNVGVQTKFNAMKAIIRGKRVVVVDDSIVRSTTITRVLAMLRSAGAGEIHVRVAAPPIVSTCPFGVDMATLAELIAANKTVDEIRRYIGADTLGYLDVPGLMRAVETVGDDYCKGCFTGKYPIPVQLEMNKMQLSPAGVA